MRRRILALVVGVTTLVVIAFVIPLALLIRHVVYQDATNSLRDDANQIANFLRGSFTAPTTAEITSELSSRSGHRTASVQLPDGKIVGTPPPDPAHLPAVSSFGDPRDGDHNGGPPQTTSVSYANGELAQLPVLPPGGGGGLAGGDRGGGLYVVRVYASDDQLHSGETGWWLLLAGSSLGLLLVGVVAGEMLTRRIVRPLVRTAHTAHELSRGETGARAPTDGPREVGEVGVALNRLADRIDELIAEERETAADLSHRLRTPLTALRLDAEALTDPAEADRIGEHVGALERTLTAVIHAARRPQREGRMPSCDATAVVGARIEFWSALAEDQNRTSSIALPNIPVLVRSSADDLAAAVDALLENVFAHTPEGTPFSVTLTATANGAQLAIADDGPGMTEDAQVRGRSDRGSSGLGLDIARRSAQASGGTFTLGSTASGGALITLTFGAP